ncbi:fatty acid desaturase, partial [Oleiphilus sp. HI0067]
IASAQKYMGKISWLTVIYTFSVVIGTIAFLYFYSQGDIPLIPAVVGLAALTYFSYSALHEAAHGNINGNNKKLQWLNDLCGYLAAPLISVPYASHRYEHMTHHRHTNQADKDPDFVISGMQHGFVSFIKTVLVFIWMQITYFARVKWDTAPTKERAIYCAELMFSLGWRVALLAYAPSIELALVLVLGFLLGGTFTAYWFAYRPHIPYQETARYRNTNNLIVPVWLKPFEWIWVGQNLHAIHHLFPRVPFYKYHALYRDIQPILRKQGTPILGVFSRKPV